MTTSVDAARLYKARGWNPTPLRPGQKSPTGTDWQRTTIPDDEIDEKFKNMNVGVVLGSQGGNLYDADLDHETVVKMQRHFMPKTPAIFGRASKRGSHLIYQAPNGDEDAKRKIFYDSDKTLLAELRGKGNQTMFPPSIHPSGEPVEWVDEHALPLIVPVADVTKALGWLCSAAMLARNWDDYADAHHVLVGALAGGLARARIKEHICETFVRAVCIYGGDHEPDDRVRIVLDTYRKLEANPDEPVTGWPALKEIIGAKKVDLILEWLDLKDAAREKTCTDDGNANRLVENFGKTLRFCHEWGKWLIWDGTRWHEDTSQAIVAYAREIPGKIDDVASLASDDDARKVLQKWANASRNISRITAMHKLAESSEIVGVHADKLDADPYAFNVANGTINLQSGGFSPHDKDDLITKLSPVTFNPRAQAPRWLHYLDGVFAGNQELIEFVQRCVGYSLTAKTIEQVFFILHGTQGTGKTTFIEILRWLFGDYARNADPKTFMEKPSNSRANPDIARLQGARFVSTSETEQSDKLAAALVKRLSGNTRITAARLYREEFEFDPVMKLWIDTNHKPRLSAQDDAIWARLVLIPFDVVFRHTERDIKGLKDLLKTELPGILKWAVDGAVIWQLRGLDRPALITDAVSEFQAESDALGHFVDDACIVAENASCGAAELYVSYVTWSENNGERPLSNRVFCQRMTERGFTQKRMKTGNRWFGIRPDGEKAVRPDFSNEQQANPFDRPQA